MLNPPHVNPPILPIMPPQKSPEQAQESREAERRRRALQRALVEADMKAADVARAAGMGNPNAIYNFFAGRTKGLSAETYRKLAQVIPGATVASLQGLERSSPGKDRTVTVKSEARAGFLRSSFDLALSEQIEAPVPIDPTLRAQGAFGVIVRNPGAEQVYPDGTILVIMPINNWEGSLATGRQVILQRIQGRQVEVTLRELRVTESKAWLYARTEDPRYIQPIEMPWPGEVTRMWRKGEDRFSIAGVVIGAYMNLP